MLVPILPLIFSYLSNPFEFIASSKEIYNNAPKYPITLVILNKANQYYLIINTKFIQIIR